MSVLTSGRKRPCDDNIGGIKEVWLATYTYYAPNLIINYKSMVVTGFPDTQFYEYKGVQKTFEENIRDDGGYDQELTIKLLKQDYLTVNKLSLILNSRLRAVVIYNSGKIKVAGLHNGLDASVSALSGGSKSDFNGYELKLTGVEEYPAPFLRAFPGYGFYDDEVGVGCLLASSGNVSSLGNKVSDCNVVQEIEYTGAVDCFLAGSTQASGASRTISDCNE